jgi:DNA-binding MarR family transcriptional regulator
MPRRGVNRSGRTDFWGSGGGREGRRRFSLLRHSHIFASLVRDILEVKFLREVATRPLTLSQFHLLKLLTLNGRHQIGEVAGLLGVSPPAASKSISKLEALDLVVRAPSTGDRRATLLSASAKGRRLVQRYEGLKADRLAPVFKEFGSEELERFSELLRRFSLCLIDQEDAGDGRCLLCSAYCEEQCAVARTRQGCPYQQSRASQGNAGGARVAARLPGKRRSARLTHR